MTRKTYYGGLLAATVIAIILFYCVYLMHPVVEAHLNFQIVCVLVYCLFCVGIYEIGSILQKKNKASSLVQFVLAVIVLKMMLSLGIVFLYYALKSPSENSYLFPFFISYVAYTVLESVYLIKVDKGQGQSA